MEEVSLKKRPAEDLAELISHGQVTTAYAMGSAITTQDTVPFLDAHFWFQYALAAMLTGRDWRPMMLEVRTMPGYSMLMEGDFLRDAALDAIRNRRFTDAKELLTESRVLHARDFGSDATRNRQAAAFMVEGRLSYAQRQYKLAVQFHQAADGLWNTMGGSADKQWQRNNRFHLFRAVVQMGSSRSAYSLGGDILRDEVIEHRKELVHQWDTWSTWGLGRLVIIIDDAFRSAHWRYLRFHNRHA